MKKTVTHEKDGLVVTEEVSYPLDDTAAWGLTGLLLGLLFVFFCIGLIVLATGA